MSRDIRSFFSILSTKRVSNPTKPTYSKKKQSIAVVESSDEDVIQETPIKQEKKEKIVKKRKLHVLSSDSDDEKYIPPKKVKEKVNAPKEILKPVKACDVFGNEPVKQAEVPSRPKPLTVEGNGEINKKSKRKKNKLLETEKFEDKKFEKTLLDLDDDFLSENMDKLDESIEVAEKQRKKDAADISISANKISKHIEKDATNINIMTKEARVPETITSKSVNGDVDISIHKTSAAASDNTSNRKRKPETYDPDEDINRHEKRRQSALLYQKYLNRSGPAHHGSKEIPKGKPDCLKNLCFIRTGVLDSLDNDEFESLIKDHGGRIAHNVSKKVNYVVAGVEPGPAKLEKANSYGIKIISENDVLDLITTKSELQVKNAKQEENSLDILIDGLNKSEDYGASQSKHTSQASTKKDKPKSVKDIEHKSTKHFYGKRTFKEKSSTVVDDPKTVNGESCTEPIVSKYFEKGSNGSFQISNSFSTSKKSNVLPEEPQTEVKKIQEFLPWTEKYKPINIKSIIGQQGDKSSMKRLMAWLENWFKHHFGKNKPKLTKPNPWAKNDDGSYFKAALLSGPPGIGKTTTAHLVSKELGFDVVEFNASDTRSKKLLQEELSQLLSSKSLAGFLTDGASPTRKHVLLMDEVDGMAGNEDRGGIQELINLIKNSSIPIICMCNDKNHQKMRSLVNYCFDLRFSRPRLEQIKGAMMSVCYKENIDINPNALNEVIVAAGMDIRQILTNLSVWSAGKNTLNLETTTKDANTAVKDVPLGQWEVCHKVFTESEHKTTSVSDRARLFYHDYSLAPLFVQENYLKVIPHAPKNEFLKRFSDAAESISMGDLVDKKIRTSNNWSLLDVQAMCASVLPGSYLRGHISGQIDFPSWLGKNSKKNKFSRLVSEIQAHMRTSISGSRSAVNLDYVTHLRNNIAKPLIDSGLGGVSAAIEIMHAYNLLREDLDGVIELSQWPKQKDPMNMVDSKIKAAFTRAYNKDIILPYSVQSAAVKKKVENTKQTDDIVIDGYIDQEETEVDSSPEDTDDISNDAMIKAKKSSGAKKKQLESKPSSTRQATTSERSGRGRKKK